jgi:hypothetical protein
MEKALLCSCRKFGQEEILAWAMGIFSNLFRKTAYKTGGSSSQVLLFMRIEPRHEVFLSIC